MVESDAASETTDGFETSECGSECGSECEVHSACVGGLSPQMMAAARDGDADTALMAIAAGAEPDAANAIGQRALHVAALWGHVNVVLVLLSEGADPNCKNEDGQTPLWFAVRNNRIPVATLLLERGAEVQPGKLFEQCKGEMRVLIFKHLLRQQLSMVLAMTGDEIPKVNPKLDELALIIEERMQAERAMGALDDEATR